MAPQVRMEELVYLFISSEVDGLCMADGNQNQNQQRSDAYVMSVLRTYEMVGLFFNKDDL